MYLEKPKISRFEGGVVSEIENVERKKLLWCLRLAGHEAERSTQEKVRDRDKFKMRLISRGVRVRPRGNKRGP